LYRARILQSAEVILSEKGEGGGGGNKFDHPVKIMMSSEFLKIVDYPRTTIVHYVKAAKSFDFHNDFIL
jgi:hypothetical protein